MDIEAVSWFLEVVHSGSFAGAAKRLNQPSSTVSRRIAHLERDLGFRLLLRTTRSLSLTQEGQSLMPLAKQLLEAQNQIHDWNESQSQTPEGRLRLTAPGDFARGPLTEWIIRFRQKYPAVEIELLHSNDYLDFQEHQLDFAFRQGPLPSSSLIAKRLFGIQYGIFASPEFVASQQPLTNPEQLSARAIITSGAHGKSLPWRFKKSVWLPKTAALLFEDMTQCLQAAAAHQGYTYASLYDALPIIGSGDLVEVLSEFRPSPAEFYLVYPDRKHRSLKNQAFLDHIEHEIIRFGKPEGLIY